VVYAASRLVDAVILDRMARFQAPSLWTRPDPGYFGIVAIWDGDWYRQIAESGYPTTIPRDDLGVAQQNPWAFYPLYPAIVRAVMAATGGSFPVAASLVSLACGAACVVVMRSLVEPIAGRALALWTVVLFCCFPSAPVLQLAYAESLSMLLVVSVLWCLGRAHYWSGAGLLILAGLARPVGVPLSAVVGLHLLRQVRAARRDGRRPRAGRLAGLAAVAVAAVAGAVAWPVIAAVVTGERNAYTDTEVAWRGSHQLTPGKPWWDISRYLLGDWVGPVVVGLVLLSLLVWVSRPRAVVIAGDLRAWALCYLGYLVVVLDPFTALARLVLPLFPLGTLLAAASPSAAYRRAVALALVAGQVVWVCWLWRFSPPADWPP
jgi:hypothetical protein